MANLQKALSLLIEAGFIVNWEKSSLIPTTNFTFLGMIWDSVEGALSLPQNKLLQLHTHASSLLNCPAPTCRQVMVLTGLVAAFQKAVPLLRLKGRFIQLSLNSSSSVEDLLRMVTLLPEARRDLLWITQLQIKDCHGPLWPPTAEDCAIEVETDASDLGFGIWFEGQLHSGRWDSIDTLTHINVKKVASWCDTVPLRKVYKKHKFVKNTNMSI
jgi:hypothetical protein